MQTIREWTHQLLISLGLSYEMANMIDNIVILLLIFIIAFAIDFVCRKTLLNLFIRIAKQTKTDWDDIILKRKIIHRLIHIIPAIFVYMMLPFAFDITEHSMIFTILQRLTMIYIIALSIQVLTSLLSVINDIYMRKALVKSRPPIKGFIQVLQVIVVFVGVVIIIATLMDKSPVALFAGLGASAAILSLVFKDSLLGFVAGIQLTANDMLRPGDWITMPKYGVDGDVLEVTLNAVKVKNFDNTTVTIPPYALVSDSFQNWRGMSDSPGRRIKRSININMDSIKFCTPEMLEKFRKIELIREYIDQKEKELHEYNEEHHIDASVIVNGRRQTNLGVFRAYLETYLKKHPNISKELTCMVRHLQPTEKGIPLELYVFSSEKRWIPYESIQADIFDHILAVIPEFELAAFQNISGADIRGLNKH